MSIDVERETATAVVGSASLLMPPTGAPRSQTPLDPQTLRDLALDQLVARLEAGRKAYDLGADYVQLLSSEAEVSYRQEVFRDLDGTPLRGLLTSFCERMVHVRRTLPSQRMRYQVERDRWFLDAASSYAESVSKLITGLDATPPRSEGLRGLHDVVRDYSTSAWFRGLVSDAADLRHALGQVTYRLRIDAGFVEVSPVRAEERDYAQDVVTTFERFRQGEGASYQHRLSEAGGLDHVQAAIASFVARLYPETFEALTAFAAKYAQLVDPQLAHFERQAQFYLAYLDVMDVLRAEGVAFCYPAIDPAGGVDVEAGRDIALALSMRDKGEAPIANDCRLAADDRVVIVTGPNQGGKTTFARAIGQIHILTALGLPVPARRATVPLVDRVSTLFETGESVQEGRGHLYDDLFRAREAMDSASGRSLVIMNEVLSSTALEDAVFLGTKLIQRLPRPGPRCIYVTFLDELSHLPGTVSLVASVDPRDPTRRTFQVLPQPANGLAFAQALADRYGLSRNALQRRLGR
ncbi:MAG: MutS-related protein [Propionibacteriaceae bacterium]